MSTFSTAFRDWRCRCGRLLFRVGPRAYGQVEAKCSRCKVAQVVTLGTTRGNEATSWE